MKKEAEYVGKRIGAFMLFLICNLACAQFSNESQLTIITNGGNTVQETWNAKTLNAYIKAKDTFKLGGHYTYGAASNQLNTRNWDVNARYERSLSNKWSAFSAVQREEDFFASLDYRWNYDVGGLYNFFQTSKHKFHVEGGYRRTLESDSASKKTNSSKIRLYSEYSREQSRNFFFKFWIEAIPSISVSEDWQLNIEPSLNLGMSKIFTLKVAYLHRYDNQPNAGLKNNDYQYTTSLIARF